MRDHRPTMAYMVPRERGSSARRLHVALLSVFLGEISYFLDTADEADIIDIDKPRRHTINAISPTGRHHHTQIELQLCFTAIAAANRADITAYRRALKPAL